MKILCVADQIDPLVYSPNVKRRFADVDMVISAGDLPMQYLGFLASSLNKEVLFVFGNHNLRCYAQFHRRLAPLPPSSVPPLLEHQFGSTYVDDRIVRVKGLLIGGLGGSMRYNDGENQYTEAQMFLRILRLLPRLLFNRLFHGRYLDILLTHAAPATIRDGDDLCHRGFRSFLWFMRHLRPRYLVHGHIHLYDLNARRRATYQKTEIINVYGHYILEIPSGDGL